ncbi:hypothetical protein A5662_03885 [Mycobacteriaceae bacterium 1482268.1]|nr:hypothetical protein A5662_03885 [Mycobacteriaceae bacterium 1482268.1]
MKTALLSRTWPIVAVLAVLGLAAGVFAAYAYDNRQHHYVARATLAMLPGPEVPVVEAAGYWEVLNGGQPTRSAAIVIANKRWLDSAATAAGVPKSALTVTAGAIPETTLITVSVQADSAQAAERALHSVLDNALEMASAVSGPFVLRLIESPDGSAQRMSPKPIQMIGALGIGGLLAGAGAGLLVSRSAQTRNARHRKHLQQEPSDVVDSQQTQEPDTRQTSDQPTAETPSR